MSSENSDLGAELVSDLFAEADKGEAAKRIVKTGGSTLNTPYAAGLTGVYNAGIAYINMTGTTYGSITYYVIGQPKMYLASKSAGTWSGWNAITTNADFQCGVINVPIKSANTATTVSIKFRQAYTTAPVVVCSPLTGAPAMAHASPQSVSSTGCNIVGIRTSGTEALDVFWMAMAR